MKYYSFLMIMAVALGCSFASCSDDDDPTVVVEPDLMDYLLGED